MEPEYQAAQRAYMRYHNMNPVRLVKTHCADNNLSVIIADAFFAFKTDFWYLE